MNLPHNVEKRFLGTRQSTAPYRGWDFLGNPYFIKEEDNNKWVARGRDHPDVLFAKTLRELGAKLADHGRPEKKENT